MRLSMKGVSEIKRLIKLSDKPCPVSKQICDDLIDTIEAMQQENKRLKAQVAAMREALEMAKEDIEEWHTSYFQDSAGGFKTIPCDGCYTCDDVLPKISEALSTDAGKDYLGTLKEYEESDKKQMKEIRELRGYKILSSKALKLAKKAIELRTFDAFNIALSAIDKALGGKKNGI